jgi:amidase
MNRRDFLLLAAAGSAAAVAAPASAKPARLGKGNGARSWAKAFELEEATVAQLQAAMQAGKLSAVSLVRKYLARIEELDQRGPALRAVIELNPDALAIARALDRERKLKEPRGPLHGIPVLIKDNVDTHDRTATTAGSLALAGSTPPRDAFIAQRLREAGAVILGKTNLSEWANFRSSHSTSGWSGRGGLTRNPYVLDRNPSGSSSGSAVAVAANLCTLAVGTETDGSILSPASFNGVVGLKPTVGLVSRSGLIPISRSQDTAGPMARTVADAAILLGCLAGQDPRDPTTAESAGKSHPDYAPFLDPDGLRGARVGVLRRFFGAHGEVDKLMETALAQMKRLGAIIIDPAELASDPHLGDAEFTVMLYEFKAGLNDYLAGLGPGAPVRSLKDIIQFNERHKDEEMPYFGQEVFLKAQAKGPLTEPAYREALELCRRASRAEGIDAVMDKERLDALVAPTTGARHRLGVRRPGHRRQHLAGGGGRLPEHHRSGGFCARTTGGDFLLWPGVQRAGAVEACLRL